MNIQNKFFNKISKMLDKALEYDLNSNLTHPESKKTNFNSNAKDTNNTPQKSKRNQKSKISIK